MKVCFFVDCFPVLSQTFVTNQITGLLDQGIEVDIVAVKKGTADLPESLSHYQLETKISYLIPPKTIKHRLLWQVFSFLKLVTFPSRFSAFIRALNVFKYGRKAMSLQLGAIVANTKMDVPYQAIIAHFGNSAVLANQLMELGVLKGKLIPIFHGFELSQTAVLAKYQSEFRKLFQSAALVLPISELWKQKCIELGCSEDKIRVVRMGIDLSQFTPKHTAGITDNVNLLTVGRLTEKKGIEFGIRALAILKQRLTIDIEYRIVGAGELLTELQQLVAELDLKKNVIFLGAQNHDQIHNLMQDADIYLQPSVTAKCGDMEGVPVTLMEAMACGLPVISTYHSGIPELISTMRDGLLVPERDSNAIASALVQIIADQNLRGSLATQARRRVEELSDNKKLNHQLAMEIQAL